MNPNSIVIRMAHLSDAAKIADVGRRAFSESFGNFNSDENLRAHLEATYRKELIESEMTAGCEFVVAESEQDGLAGFGKLRKRQQPDCVPGQALEVHQIYLLGQFHRLGIGSRLMKGLVDLARERGADGVYLGVYEKADWGIAFYEKFGFHKVGEHVFRVGDDDQIDWLMYLKLDS